jgi:23S rRNA pseudouridine1911/1915/1917 synthase
VPAAARLLHLDDRLAALAKPPGLSLSTPRAAPGEAARRLVQALPEDERRLLEDSELHLVHRLDVGTSGVVVVARDAAMHRDLVRAFAERRVEKVYLALVWGHPKPSAGRLDSPLGPDRRDRRRMRVDPAGRAALTLYRTLARAPHVALLELRPQTGRTHQLRVHLAAAGHPIVGDDLYGGPRHHGVRDRTARARLRPDHPFLHAWRLSLPAPPLSSPLSLTAALPADFERAVAALGLSGARSADSPGD